MCALHEPRCAGAGQPDIVYMILYRWDGKKVFLQDGDALVYPYPKLVEALQYLNQKFPGH